MSINYIDICFRNPYSKEEFMKRCRKQIPIATYRMNQIAEEIVYGYQKQYNDDVDNLIREDINNTFTRILTKKAEDIVSDQIDKNKKRYDKKIPMKEFNDIKDERKMGSLIVEVKEKMIEDSEYEWVEGYVKLDFSRILENQIKNDDIAIGKIFALSTKCYGIDFYKDAKSMLNENIPVKLLFGGSGAITFIKVSALVSRMDSDGNSMKEFIVEDIIPESDIPKFIESDIIFGDTNHFEFIEVGCDLREGLINRFDKIVQDLFAFSSDDTRRAFITNILFNRQSALNRSIHTLDNWINRGFSLNLSVVILLNLIDEILKKLYDVLVMLQSEGFDTKEMINFMKDYKIN